MSFLNELKRRNVLRVAAAYLVSAWLVIQVVETIFPAFGFSDAAVRIATIIFAIGLIPTLIFAWAFELTPEGLKKESEVDRSQSITPHAGKKLDRMIMVVLALALGYFAFDKFVLNPQREATEKQLQAEQLAKVAEQSKQEGRTEAIVESYGDKSIVVLPFADMSSNGDQEYFSDGLAEELLNLLARLPELRVISRSSAFSFKGTNKPVREIARMVNVQYVLEGSVRKSRDKLRVTVQLIDATTDTHLWSETYDETLEEVFAVQDNIAESVVEKLHVTLLGEPSQTKAIDPEAYSLYLQGKHVRQNQRNVEGTLKAEELLLASLKIEPGYIESWNELRATYYGQGMAGARPWPEVSKLQAETLDKVEALDPDDPGLVVGRARIAWEDGRYQESLNALAKAFNATRNSGTVFWTYVRLRDLGRYEDSEEVERWWRTKDPASCASYMNTAYLMLFKSDFHKVVENTSRAKDLCPTQRDWRHWAGFALVQLGQFSEAVVLLEMEPRAIYRLHGLVIANHAAGNEALSDQFLEQLKNVEPVGRDPYYWIASAYAYSGETDAVFEWLNRIEKESRNYVWNDPWLRPVANDPRYLALVDEYGITKDELDKLRFQIDLKY